LITVGVLARVQLFRSFRQASLMGMSFSKLEDNLLDWDGGGTFVGIVCVIKSCLEAGIWFRLAYLWVLKGREGKPLLSWQFRESYLPPPSLGFPTYKRRSDRPDEPTLRSVLA
jgi:hypothetical protein